MMQAVVTVLVALITVFFSGILLESYKRHRDRQGVAAVLGAEITSILHITERGCVIENFAALLPLLDEGTNVPFPQVYTMEPSYGPIFERNIEKIGLLSTDVSVQVVKFYGYIFGLRSALRNLVSGAWEEHPRAANIKAAQIRSGLMLWSEATTIATPLVTNLRAISSEAWRPFPAFHKQWLRT